jgi:hypothetical protein
MKQAWRKLTEKTPPELKINIINKLQLSHTNKNDGTPNLTQR